MAKLVMCKGLPGSGKSTYAKLREAERGYVRVNKDDIRRELDPTGKWNTKFEDEVIKIRDQRITEALTSGKNVISDDTNLHKKHEDKLRQIAEACGAEFEIDSSFLRVTVDECIKRDAQRTGDAHVGEKVIRDMAKKYNYYLQVKVEPYPVTPGLPLCVICDLDGTLCIHNNRGPYDHDKAADDLCNKSVAHVIHLFDFTRQARIIYLSGREEKYREQSLEFMRKNGCPKGDGFYMRTTGDFRNDTIVKKELFDAHIRGKYNVLFCMDDRDRIVKLWRDMGLSCFQVNYGDF